MKEEEARWHSGCWLGVDGLAAPVKVPLSSRFIDMITRRPKGLRERRLREFPAQFGRLPGVQEF